MGGTSSKLEESSKVDKKSDDGDARVGFIVMAENGSRNVPNNQYENEKERPRIRSNPRIPRRVPEASKGEQIAAGWPNWLAAVAGEAIEGWLPRRPDTFEKIDKIGEGTYSHVYKARDSLTGQIVALKKVRFDNLEPESIKFMVREILILRRLDHPNVIKLEGLVTTRMSVSLYLIFKYMEHDLTGLASLPGVAFTEPQIKCYMLQLISGLQHCHNRGVLHRDVKSSNLLINDQGTLKIADFGLSTFFDSRQKLPLTSRIVTLWYRSPELLLGATQYGVAVDLWSTGCVLAELYAGRPVMPGKTEVEQLHKIFKLCGSSTDDYWRKAKLPNATIFKPEVPYKQCLAETFADISPTALGLMETLLSIDPDNRGTASSALQSEFFTTEPFACDPLSLPKYPPSKEMDAKFREPHDRQFVPKFQQDNDGRSKSKRPQGSAAPLHKFAMLAQSKQEKEMHPSGPSDKVNRMLNEHDQRIQNAILQENIDKRRLSKVLVQRSQETDNPKYSRSSSQIPWHDPTEMLEPNGHQHMQEVPQEMKPKIRRGRTQAQETSSRVFSGPSIVPSCNVDQLLEEHDRHIQESAQKLWLQKRRGGKTQAQQMQTTVNPVSSSYEFPSIVSVNKVDELLEEHDRQIQESTERLRLQKKRAGKAQAKGYR